MIYFGKSRFILPLCKKNCVSLWDRCDGAIEHIGYVSLNGFHFFPPLHFFFFAPRKLPVISTGMAFGRAAGFGSIFMYFFVIASTSSPSEYFSFAIECKNEYAEMTLSTVSAHATTSNHKIANISSWFWRIVRATQKHRTPKALDLIQSRERVSSGFFSKYQACTCTYFPWIIRARRSLSMIIIIMPNVLQYDPL